MTLNRILEQVTILHQNQHRQVVHTLHQGGEFGIKQVKSIRQN